MPSWELRFGVSLFFLLAKWSILASRGCCKAVFRSACWMADRQVSPGAPLRCSPTFWLTGSVWFCSVWSTSNNPRSLGCRWQQCSSSLVRTISLSPPAAWAEIRAQAHPFPSQHLVSIAPCSVGRWWCFSGSHVTHTGPITSGTHPGLPTASPVAMGGTWNRLKTRGQNCFRLIC